MTIDNLDNLETAAGALLAKEASPSPARIRELIGQFRNILPVDDDVAEELARKFEMRHGVTMTIGAILTERGFEPWLDSARVQIDPYYWQRYKRLLVEKHFSGQVIATLDSVTDKVLGLMENPLKEGPWDRRGMVVGHVQSGKTANYIGLICKAADAGYKVIVVIAGIHNNLRNQTQLRIDEGFVGRDSARLLSKKDERFVGVGRFDTTRRPVTFTNSVKDFNKGMATGLGIPLKNLNETAVFVIKKNSTTLKNLIDWLKEHSAEGGTPKVTAPMLLIDDEADNASVNIKFDKDEVSRINGQIRELLSLFERSCYVGYTATPFANIFIDPESDHAMVGHDLFPRHFISSLDPPTSYFGPQRVFLDESKRFIRHITDDADQLPLRHRIDFKLAALPDSLADAVRAFILARAIRLTRGHENQHCSMLVNASRFTEVQRQLRNEIHTRLELIQSSLRINGALPPAQAARDPEIAELFRVWNVEYLDASEDWSAVLSRLHDAAAPVKVVEVNSRSSGTLNYADHEKNGLSVIAVGGFSLSRGLTLEGLLVSYFLRNSTMYDTLMQMGRWFGFRLGYEDLCRIWMPEEAEGWYAHIADSIEQLRSELRIMEAAGATPQEFGLKVRSHPDALLVTARNKFGSGEKVVVNIGLGNSFVETAILKRAEASLVNNRNAARSLVSALKGVGIRISDAERVRSGFLVSKAPVDVVDQFLAAFDNHPGSMLSDPAPVRRYIEDRAEGELKHWDILFASLKQADSDDDIDELLGIPITLQRRSAGDRSDAFTIRVTNKQRVASRGIERTAVDTEVIEKAQKSYRIEKGLKDDDKEINYPDRIYRVVRKRPLLIVHLLKIDPVPDANPCPSPVVAWSISFPKTAVEEKKVEYIVNTTWLRENFSEDLDEDEIAGDND